MKANNMLLEDIIEKLKQGIGKIYKVVDGEIQLRMELPQMGILEKARTENLLDTEEKGDYDESGT